MEKDYDYLNTCIISNEIYTIICLTLSSQSIITSQLNLLVGNQLYLLQWETVQPILQIFLQEVIQTANGSIEKLWGFGVWVFVLVWFLNQCCS